MTQKLTLIRHGAIAPCHDHRYIGRSDVALCAAGARQATRLVARLAGGDIDALWSSPALRARQTADPISEKLQLTVEIVPELNEVDFGRWEGLTFEDICKDDPQHVSAWADFAPDFSFPEGESQAAFQSRVQSVAQRLTQYDHKHVALVTHGGVIRALICLLLGLSPRDYLLFEVNRGAHATLTLHEGRGVLTGLYND